MKDTEVANMLAMMGDAEARSTAALIEVIAAAVLVKLAPPSGNAVAELVIGQGDLSEVGTNFFWRTEYDEHGTMRLYVTRSIESLIAGQNQGSGEVTSDAN